MTIGYRKPLIFALMPALCLLQSSCTTLSTGVLASPLGINGNSFRACLLDNGFFTPTALTGTAKDDYIARHAADKVQARPRQQIMAMGDLQFIGETSKALLNGMLPHQQYGGGAGAADLVNAVGDRPYGYNRNPPAYDANGYAAGIVPEAASGEMRLSIKINRYLDCYIAPVGVEGEGAASGLISPNTGDTDLEGRLLRAHILLALIAQYGAELVTSHASAKQANYATLLLKDISAAELELRMSSPVMDRKNLKVPLGLVEADGSLTVPSDSFAGKQAMLRWDNQVTRVLRVFQVAKDDQVVDAKQSLDRIINLVAAFGKPSLGVFSGILNDALKGLGSMQKIKLYGDALLMDGRETLATHRLNLQQVQSGYAITGLASAEQRWKLWDDQITRACSVLAAVAKDTTTTCVPSAAVMDQAFAQRWPALAPADAGQ